MNRKKLLQFLLKARTKTYAGNGGRAQPAFSGSNQLEYKEEDWLYRDIYYSGRGKFMGLEVVYYKRKPVWSMSYYGSCKEQPEQEIYDFLKQALLENWKSARIWKEVEWKKGNYKYTCQPDFEGSIEEFAGVEKIFKEGRKIYQLFYAGALIK